MLGKKENKTDNKKSKKTAKQLKNWYQDRYETVTIQRNIFFLIFIIMLIIFGFTIVGVIKLNSKKVYEPFIVQVEENTGIITKVNSDQVRNSPVEKAVRNSSLVRYVISRESYNYADFTYQYYTVTRLMSSSNVYNEFKGYVNPNNPSSPVAMGFDQKVEVTIKSIIDIDEKQNQVQIRITKKTFETTSGKPYQPRRVKNYIITLKYVYANLGLSETERYINPLGIQIIAYRIDEEQNAKNF